MQSMDVARVLRQTAEPHDSTQMLAAGSLEHRLIYQRVLSVLQRNQSVNKICQYCAAELI